MSLRRTKLSLRRARSNATGADTSLEDLVSFGDFTLKPLFDRTADSRPMRNTALEAQSVQTADTVRPLMGTIAESESPTSWDAAFSTEAVDGSMASWEGTPYDGRRVFGFLGDLFRASRTRLSAVSHGGSCTTAFNGNGHRSGFLGNLRARVATQRRDHFWGRRHPTGGVERLSTVEAPKSRAPLVAGPPWGLSSTTAGPSSVATGKQAAAPSPQGEVSRGEPSMPFCPLKRTFARVERGVWKPRGPVFGQVSAHKLSFAKAPDVDRGEAWWSASEKRGGSST